MGALPTGTVTFLFTDVDGSTELLKRLRGRYHEVLAEHRRLLRAAFLEYGGTEVDTQGDGFFVAFPRARDAVAAAVAAQRALAGKAWPEKARVRVRMGLHTGEPYRADEGYVGMGVHRAARICTSAHGGQVLLSRSTAGIIDDEDLADVELRDLGDHQLKDIDRPERIFQLVIGGLPSQFPPIRSLDQQVPLSGTVTIVFTDIRESQRLFRELPEDFGALLNDYRRLLQEVFEEMSGGAFEAAFDSVSAAFPTAKKAALAAAAAQKAVATYEWPRGQKLKMSVALHSGEAGVGWIGPAVALCASLCDAAQAGQIVLSQAASSLLEEQDLGDLWLRDLGEQRLEDGERPVRLYELVVPVVAEMA